MKESPPFWVIVMTIIKVIIAVVLIVFVIGLSLVITDQFIYSFTG